MYFLLQDGDFPASYVCLPEGNSQNYITAFLPLKMVVVASNAGFIRDSRFFFEGRRLLVSGKVLIWWFWKIKVWISQVIPASILLNKNQKIHLQWNFYSKPNKRGGGGNSKIFGSFTPTNWGKMNPFVTSIFFNWVETNHQPVVFAPKAWSCLPIAQWLVAEWSLVWKKCRATRWGHWVLPIPSMYFLIFFIYFHTFGLFF